MTTLAYTVPVAGTDLNSIADPEIATALTSIKTAFNGNIDVTNLSAAAQATLLGAAWVPLTLGTGIVAFAGAGTYTPSARLEGDVVRLKGCLQNTSGGSLAPSSTLATLSSGLRPTAVVYSSARADGPNSPLTYYELQIGASGTIVNAQGSVPNNGQIRLDGLTFTTS